MKDFMSRKRARRFQIEIYFVGLRGRAKLGIAAVYAESEAEALEIARAHTSYKIGGVDKLSWQVREPMVSYAKMTA